MPIKKIPGPKGGYRATYGGVTRNFATRAAAEKWASKYKSPRVGAGPRRGAGPGRGGSMSRKSRAY